jgi:phage shock protein PspC (stress-responsive transcriptional regulator)
MMIEAQAASISGQGGQPAGHRAGHQESIVGICKAIGEDLGIHPDILRVAMAVGLLFAPIAVVAAYAGMGLFVLASRLLFPPVRRPAARVIPIAEPVTEPEPARLLEAA